MDVRNAWPKDKATVKKIFVQTIAAQRIVRTKQQNVQKSKKVLVRLTRRKAALKLKVSQRQMVLVKARIALRKATQRLKSSPRRNKYTLRKATLRLKSSPRRKKEMQKQRRNKEMQKGRCDGCK
jgi:hypothetical protein